MPILVLVATEDSNTLHWFQKASLGVGEAKVILKKQLETNIRQYIIRCQIVWYKWAVLKFLLSTTYAMNNIPYTWINK